MITGSRGYTNSKDVLPNGYFKKYMNQKLTELKGEIDTQRRGFNTALSADE